MSTTTNATLNGTVAMPAAPSKIGALYEQAYGFLCGRHPRLLPWHFHWLATRDLYRDLREALPGLTGRVLDVGCGEKPYAQWLTGSDECVGIDVAPGPGVDMVITPGQTWPLEAGTFDAVLCTQVIEHAGDLDNLLSELNRVLAPGGTLLVTVPFAYNEHGAPGDYRRFSVHGVRALFSGAYELVELKSQGGIGSTTGLLFLNWVDQSMNRSRVTRLAKGALLPFWILLTAVVNALGWAFDHIDGTRAFYSNVFMLARKK
jgi:SAM-dependent methyltransferase